MLKNILRRIKVQKGMSGVLVALMLVVVGVGLVAGVSTYLTDAKSKMLDQADIALKDLNITGVKR